MKLAILLLSLFIAFLACRSRAGILGSKLAFAQESSLEFGATCHDGSSSYLVKLLKSSTDIDVPVYYLFISGGESAQAFTISGISTWFKKPGYKAMLPDRKIPAKDHFILAGINGHFYNLIINSDSKLASLVKIRFT